MICDRCKEQGLKSTITERGMAHYAMFWEPYYDEEGNYHSHDINNNGSLYHCSKGHNFFVRNVPQCPTEDCEWNIENVSWVQTFSEDDPPRKPEKIYDLGTENSIATTSEIPDIVFDLNSFETWSN